ncbi:MAG: acyl carrier protein [Cyanobacteriota bacterium]|nr:acyl carrier protein [Cyanobacteriota bacterium]
MESIVPNTNAPAESITDRLIAMIEDMTSDWDITTTEELNRNTQLIADLAFESIDIVQLVVAIEESFKKRGLPFEQVLMEEGRYVDDLTIGELSDFLQVNL